MSYRLVIALLIGALACGAASAVQSEMPPAPDVLVLVLSGFGSVDQISINYNSIVSEQDVKRDISSLSKECAWIVDAQRITSKSPGTAGGVKTTSGSFQTLCTINYADGTLPVEALVRTLKRFKSIELNFIVPEGFSFRGPQDYEDEFVKIGLNRNGSAFVYRVRVKKSGFDRLNLTAARSPQQTKAVGRKESRNGLQIAIIVLVALCCAVAVFYAGRAISGKRPKSGTED